VNMESPHNGLPGAQNQSESLSSVLSRLTPGADGRISLNQLDALLADRSFGAFLVVFALPNLIPLPPGATLILGLPLIMVSWQMLASRYNRIWLPKRLANLSADGARAMKLLEQILPWLERIEAAIKPRAWFLTTRRSERVLGAFSVVLSIVVFIPIPFGNWLPALALAIIGLSLTERDGYGIVVGMLLGVVAIIVAAMVVLAVGALLAFLL